MLIYPAIKHTHSIRYDPADKQRPLHSFLLGAGDMLIPAVRNIDGHVLLLAYVASPSF